MSELGWGTLTLTLTHPQPSRLGGGRDRHGRTPSSGCSRRCRRRPLLPCAADEAAAALSRTTVAARRRTPPNPAPTQPYPNLAPNPYPNPNPGLQRTGALLLRHGLHQGRLEPATHLLRASRARRRQWAGGRSQVDPPRALPHAGARTHTCARTRTHTHTRTRTHAHAMHMPCTCTCLQQRACRGACACHALYAACPCSPPPARRAAGHR